jgi:serine/threonine protein phosphatase PrpC
MEIAGASVGDSEAWLLEENTDILTAHQQRKPLIGSGRAAPVPFRRERVSGSLLVGSDGLFKYASEPSIRAAFHHEAPARVADALMEAVRLPSGALHDDVAAIVVQL